MNKFQRERKAILGSATLSEQRQRAVIARVQARRTKRWVPLTSAAVLLVLLLAIVRPWEEAAPPIVQANYSEQGVVQFMEQEVYATSIDWIEVAHAELIDAQRAIAVIYARDNPTYATVYMLQFADAWSIVDSTSIPLDEGASYMPWQAIGSSPFYVAAGLFENVDRVWVGEQQAKTITIGAHKVWLQSMTSLALPVVYEQDGTWQRIAPDMLQQVEEDLPFMMPSDSMQTMSWSGTDMYTGKADVTTYPIVVDPHYYATNPYAEGDIVVVQTGNEPRITRIVALQTFTEIAIETQTLLIGGMPANNLYAFGRYDGDEVKHNGQTIQLVDDQLRVSQLNSDEVFVMPDNWASDGIKGAISKFDIVGKVVGYDKSALPFTWDAQEVARYEAYKQSDYQQALPMTPNELLRLHYLAMYNGDYETLYHLFSRNSLKASYDEWFATVNFVPLTNERKAELNYLALDAQTYTFNEVYQTLEKYNVDGTVQASFKMEREQSEWRFVWETVTRTFN